MAYDPACVALADKIRPLCASVKAKPPYWIEGPDRTFEGEYCADCAYYKWRNLRRHDRKRAEDYYRAGGYRSENDNFAFCAGCGCRLDISPTRYCCEETVAQYQEYGFTTSSTDDAYEILEVLESMDWICDRENDADRELRKAAISLSEKLIASQSALQEQPQ